MVDATGTKELFGHLVTDSTSAWYEWKEKKNIYTARNFVRAAFATVEGTISSMKADCLTSLEGDGIFTPPELHFLNEYSYRIDDQGCVVDGNDFIPLKRNVRFTLNMFGKMVGSTVDYGVDGYRLFQEAIEIRNRVTHPKALSDVQLSDTDMDTVERGFNWFQAVADDLLIKLVRMMVRRLADLQKESGITLAEVMKATPEATPE